MPAKPSGEVKKGTVRCTQKNGDIYILERETLYDPSKKRNKVLSSRLVGKIVKDTDVVVATRPKRATVAVPSSAPAQATRRHAGMMDIIEHAGRASGIDDAVYGATDEGTAQKILSLARYLVATDGQSLPGIQTWQYSHRLPYVEGISEDIYHGLFKRVGADESLQQSFFMSRAAGVGSSDAIAYDSTTVSTYSAGQPEARYGFNKGGDGMKTVKLLTLYSIEKRQPIAFTKQSGNLPDVVTISNAVAEMSVLGLKTNEVVTDNGYYSEDNISERLQAGLGFITLAKTSLSWIYPEIDRHMDELEEMATVCPFDAGIHAVTVTQMREFRRHRKYASKSKGLANGDEETFTKRIYLHIYYNALRRVEDRISFEKSLMEIKALLEGGKSVDELSESARSKAEKYMTVSGPDDNGAVTVSYNNDAIASARKYHGYFALVTNREKDPFECLRKYRRRETIESFFGDDKQRTDGDRLRMWDTDTLRGRMFVQFVALCYHEYLAEEVRKMKAALGQPTGDSEHDKKETLKQEERLRSWLEKTPLYLQLQWFDVIDEVTVSTALGKKRWSTECVARDKMYLNKLGVTPTQ